MTSSLKNNATQKTINTRDGSVIAYAEFCAAASKPIIDVIDRRLAELYGFSAPEAEFIINYDIKYRMGQDDPGGESE